MQIARNTLLGVLFSAASLAAAGATPLRLQTALHSYTSSVDGVRLYLRVVYPDQAAECPVLAIVHGYSGAMGDVYPTQQMLASRGLFTVAPAMRGRDNSDGLPDDSAWEIADIVDAVETVLRLYPDETHAENVNVIGYSGGGGNVFGCLSKYPATFRFAASFFGMSDYGHDLTYGWYNYGGEEYRPLLRERIGGAPEEVPERYMARSSLLAVANNRYTAFQMYVDSEEVTCPAYNDTTYLRRAEDLGYDNVTLCLSTPDSTYRWHHGYPHNIPDLEAAFDNFVPGILSAAYPPISFVPAGSQTVIGYVNVPPFTLILGDGMSEVADLSYDVSRSTATPAEAWLFNIESRTARIDAAILSVRGLIPGRSYLCEHEDITHGTLHQMLVDADSLGRLEVRAAVDRASLLRLHEVSAADVAESKPHSAPPDGVFIFPNPFRTTLTVRARLETGTGPPVSALLYDAAGRLMARAPGQPLGRRFVLSGVEFWEFRWSGLGTHGHPLPAGLYFTLIRSRDQVLSRRVLRIE